MKILFVHPSLELYGADKILLYLLQMLSPKHEITVLLPKNGTLVEYIGKISANINIIVSDKLPIVHSKLKICDYLKLPFYLRDSQHLFSKYQFDYCFCNTLATILLLFVPFSKRKVLYVHEIIASKFLNLGFSFLARLGAQTVICVSTHVKENLFFSKKYFVIHNGIPDIPECFIKNKIQSDGKIRFVLPGRFMPQKGQWFLLSSLEKYLGEYKNKIHIDLFGSAPPFKPELYQVLQNEISQKNLQDTVSIHNFTEDIWQVYERANVVLVPSLMADPFPTTVIESLMFSRPVIATNHGGASEILDDSFSKTIQPGDELAFAEAIKFFVVNQNLLDEYSYKAREKYKSYLTSEKFKKRFLDIFQTLR